MSEIHFSADKTKNNPELSLGIDPPGALATQMTSPEVKTTDDLGTAISKAGLDVGVELDPARLAQLKELGTNYRNNLEEGFKTAFLKSGLLVYPAVREDDTLVAYMHFRPKTSEFDQAEIPQPKEAAQIAQVGIQAVQDYLLLVRSGVIARPDVLRGATNPTMANVATRLGFSPDGYDKKDNLRLVAPFQAVHDAAFSAKVLTFARRLSQHFEPRSN